MRVLFCGGGTAGHVNPAIAIAETIIKNSPESKIAYVATINGIENSLINYKKYHIDVKGINKKFSLSNIKKVAQWLEAIKMSQKIIREFRPNIVVGTGGYATFPVIYGASKMGIKTVIHESNYLPGKANKALQKHVDKIFLNYNESKKYFKCKDKLVHTGNPLRLGFGIENKDVIKNKLGIKEKIVIVCYGGSLGARRINESAIEVIDNLIKYEKDVRFIWATGKSEYNEVSKRLMEKHLYNLSNINVSEYIYNMPQIISTADIVISRAGAMSISELAASNKCAILIPSPNVADNHQYKNAELLQKRDAAVLVTENQLYLLTDVIKELISSNEKRQKLSENIGNFYKKDANKIIFEQIKGLINIKY